LLQRDAFSDAPVVVEGVCQPELPFHIVGAIRSGDLYHRCVGNAAQRVALRIVEVPPGNGPVFAQRVNRGSGIVMNSDGIFVEDVFCFGCVCSHGAARHEACG